VERSTDGITRHTGRLERHVQAVDPEDPGAKGQGTGRIPSVKSGISFGVAMRSRAEAEVSFIYDQHARRDRRVSLPIS
jgi:hypothetical protein